MIAMRKITQHGSLITIFSMPSPEQGSCRDRQRNAFQSWAKLKLADVKLLATRADAPQIEKAFGYAVDVADNASPCGRPFVSDILRNASQLTSSPLVAFINSDIVLDATFDETVHYLSDQNKPFLASARRREVGFAHAMTADSSRKACPHQPAKAATPRLGAKAAMDLFIWRRDSRIMAPPLVVGRRGWDNWLLWYARSQQWRAIDCTEVLNVMHQTHSTDTRQYLRQAIPGVLADQNLIAIADSSKLLTLRDCTHKLLPDGSLQRRWLSCVRTHPLFLPLWTRSVAQMRRLRIAMRTNAAA